MSERFSTEELEGIFGELFKRIKRERIFYFEYREHLESQGYNEDELREIWTEAYRRRIIDVGVFPLNGKAETVFEKYERKPRPDFII